MAKKQQHGGSSSDHHKEFEKIIRKLCYKRPIWQVFSDFCEMSAMSFANAIIQNEARERRYLDIIKHYEHEEVQEFPRLLGVTVQALSCGFCDFLGEAFQQLELASHWHGQFFTPFHLGLAMAKLSVSDGLKDTIDRQGFITVQEPACGAGAMVIALAQALYEAGINPQRAMHVMAIDVDPTAAHMAFIQLSLYHIPAAVWIGNTLSMEMRECFLTPAHHLGFWSSKLERHRRGESVQPPAALQFEHEHEHEHEKEEPVEPAAAATVAEPEKPQATARLKVVTGEQLDLFGLLEAV